MMIFHELGRGARIVHNEDSPRERVRMARAIIAVPYVVVMIAVIVTVDTRIFRNHFWRRLMVNIGIVLVFGQAQIFTPVLAKRSKSFSLDLPTILEQL